MRHIPEIVILLTELENLENHSLDVENSPSSTLTFSSIHEDSRFH